jgi:hypothetical protein
MLKLKLAPALLAAALLLVFAIPATAGGINPPFPKTGKWTIGSGSFVLTKGKGKSGKKKRYVTNFKATSDPEGNGCAQTATPIELVGKHKLTIFARGGYRSWGVGKNTPSTSNGVTPIPVKVKVNGASVAGLFSIVWNTGSKEIIGAELDYANGGTLVPYCTSYYSFGKHK